MGGPCVPGTLSRFVNLGPAGCTIAGVTFGSFQSLPNLNLSIQIPTQSAIIAPLGTGQPGFTVQVTANAQAGFLDELRFSFVVSGGTVTGSTITSANTSMTGDGAVTEIQDFCFGGQFGDAAVLTGCAGATGTLLDIAPGTMQAAFNPVSTVQVVADITVDGGTSGSASGGSFVNQFTATAGGGGGSTPPFGVIDTPADNATGISGALSVTGWALSQAGVNSVLIEREPVAGEAGSNLILLGNAAIVPGARPDVAAAYPGYPNNSAGYGAQILTNELPNSNGTAGVGNGTYRIHVVVTDNSGQTKDLGVRTVTVSNSGATTPFGTIDTPAQGATISGNNYVNFGWAVTPQPAIIPTDGSTITVFIDNIPVGHPTYNQFRSDIATLFPGLQNSNGAVGFYRIDTTKLVNGLHTIAWSVSDNLGHAAGIGSRYFNVQN